MKTKIATLHTASCRCLLLLFIYCLLPTLLKAQWNFNPSINNAVCTALYAQFNPTIVSDGSGGAIISWMDYRNGYADIYAQRIDAAGVVQWTTDGIAICTAVNSQLFPTIVSDGFGGAIITWQDNRFEPFNIYAQHINAAGTIQWPANGIAICTAVNEQLLPTIVSDGSGGATITWYDYRSGPYDIYAQRINAIGITQWAPDGIAICTAANAQKNPTIVSDDIGGAIITWQDYRSGNNDIYAQLINSAGVVQWTTDGIAICIAANDQANPVIVSDVSGGAIITWRDLRSGAYNYVQRINAAGVTQWATDGIIVSATLGGYEYPTIISDGSGGAIITFTSGNNIYAQRIDASGTVQWTTDGMAVCTASGGQSTPIVISDGIGGAVISWIDGRNLTDNNIYAQRINAGGIVQWTIDGVVVSTAASSQSNQTITTDGNGGAIIAWEDYRNGSDNDIFVQRINPNGSLFIGAEESNLNINVFPNPSNGVINIKVETEISSIEIMDVHGRKIAYNLIPFFNGTTNTGEQSKIELLNVTTGIYFVLVNTIDGVYRTKIIVD